MIVTMITNAGLCIYDHQTSFGLSKSAKVITDDVAELWRLSSAPAWGALGASWQNGAFLLGSPNEVSLFLLSFYLFFLFPLTINHRSEGRRKEITAMFLVLAPAGWGGCYFRLNQLPAGSLDEMPPHGNLLKSVTIGRLPPVT